MIEVPTKQGPVSISYEWVEEEIDFMIESLHYEMGSEWTIREHQYTLEDGEWLSNSSTFRYARDNGEEKEFQLAVEILHDAYCKALENIT
jgi:predicted HAD superfamily Cof-like phosphohydrolase